MAFLLFASLLVSVASAQAAQQPDITPMLNSAFVDARCRVAFETGFMNEVITAFPSMAQLLEPRITDMKTDESQLGSYVSKGDAMNYSRYIQEVFSKHLKQDGEAIKSGFEAMKANMTQPPSGGGTPPDSGTGGGTPPATS